jgi:hypothetical protein
MAYEQKEMGGSLFKNDKKNNDKWPDYRGKALINGQLLDVAGWVRESKGGKFLSLAFSIPKPKADAPAAPKSDPPPWGAATQAQPDDQLPF